MSLEVSIQWGLQGVTLKETPLSNQAEDLRGRVRAAFLFHVCAPELR